LETLFLNGFLLGKKPVRFRILTQNQAFLLLGELKNG
jgi:hypothetical protein